MNTTLDLPLKAKWYNLIESGIKTEEYREMKKYWDKRLLRYYTHVRFRYGYTKRTMTFNLKEITIDEGNPNWGAIPGEKYYVLKLGNRIN